MSDTRRMNWLTVVIAVLWAALLTTASVDNWLARTAQEARASEPVTNWFRAGLTLVSDAPAGTCPPMTFDRDINRPFHAEWTVTIMMQSDAGEWVTHRTFEGANDYRPENSLPEALDLCWWAWADGPEALGLEPGRTYRVNTLWEIDTGDAGMRTVRRTSPPFTITE